MKPNFFSVTWIAIVLILHGGLVADDASIGRSALSALAAGGDDAIGYIHWRNPQEFLTKVNGLARKASNPNFNAITALNLGKVLHNSALEGVDLTQPITVILLNPKKYTREFSCVTTLTASDVETFLNAVGVDSPDTAFKLNPDSKSAPVREYNRTIKTTDRKGYEAALAAGQNVDLSDFQKNVTESFSVGITGKQLVVGPNKDIVTKALNPSTAMNPSILTGDLVANIRVPILLQSYADEIQTAQSQVESLVGVGGGPQASQAKMGVQILQMSLEAARSSKSIEMAANFNEGNLDLTMALTPMPGTDVANFIAAQKPQKPDAYDRIPDSASIASMFQIHPTAANNVWVERLLKPILSAQGAEAGKGDEALKLIQQNMANWGGEMSLYALPAPQGRGLNAIIVQRVQDSAKAREMVSQGIQMQAKMPKQPGIQQTFTCQKDAAKLGEIPVDQYIVQTTLEDKQQAQRMAMMGLGEMTLNYAFPPNYVVGEIDFGTTTPSKLESLQKAINTLATAPAAGNLSQSADFKTATKGFPTEVNGFFFISSERLVPMLANSLPPQAAMGFGMISPMLVGAGINFSGFVLIKPENAQVQLRIPLENILDTVGKVRDQFKGGNAKPAGL